MSNQPLPWSTPRSNIPWDEPGFSQRMLAEHLDPTHDRASRDFATIDRQVTWIHGELLGARPSSILDLACGPGLYTERLARLGHSCHGIDIGPASIEYARTTAKREDLTCTYELGDLRHAEPGEGFELVTFLYGEPSVFSPVQLRAILSRAAAALEPEGQLLIEPLTRYGVECIGAEAAAEQSFDRGLFLDSPHTLWSQGNYDAGTGVASRHWIVSPASGEPGVEHWAWYQGYTDADLAALLVGCGFDESSIGFLPNLTDDPDPPILQFVTASRRTGTR